MMSDVEFRRPRFVRPGDGVQIFADQLVEYAPGLVIDWLADVQHDCFVDWQRLSMGDPVPDIARGHAENWWEIYDLYRQSVVSAAEPRWIRRHRLCPAAVCVGGWQLRDLVRAGAPDMVGASQFYWESRELMESSVLCDEKFGIDVDPADCQWVMWLVTWVPTCGLRQEQS